MSDDTPAQASDVPTPSDLVEQLHMALYGESWARPEPPAEMWTMLIERVSDARCYACFAREAQLAALREAAQDAYRLLMDLEADRLSDRNHNIVMGLRALLAKETDR